MFNCLLRHVKDKVISTHDVQKSGGLSRQLEVQVLPLSACSSSSRRFGSSSGRDSISDDPANSKTLANYNYFWPLVIHACDNGSEEMNYLKGGAERTRRRVAVVWAVVMMMIPH
jgi:hypothetical protein